MLCRWALVMQEYDFSIIRHNSFLNTNADALPRLALESVDSSCEVVKSKTSPWSCEKSTPKIAGATNFSVTTKV